jgi:hypothetical protein
MTARRSARPSVRRRLRLAVPGMAMALVATVVTTTVTTGTAHAASWFQLSSWPVPGGASDIGIGPQGHMWATSLDGRVFQFGPSGWQDRQMSGFGVRLTVDFEGNAWVVRSNNSIRRWTGSSWQTVSGLARDLGNGGGGQIWRASTTGVVYRWNFSTGAWNNMGGADVIRIDAEVGGVAWVVQSDGDVWRWNGGVSWTEMGGQAQDIGLGVKGNPWATLEGTTDTMVFEFVGGTWLPRDGIARNVDVDQFGQPLVVQSNGSIWWYQ